MTLALALTGNSGICGGLTAPKGVAISITFTTIAVSWSAVAAASTYNLYRGTSSGGETLYQSGLSGTSYTDSSVTDGTTYFYKVTAVNGGNESSKSSEVSSANGDTVYGLRDWWITDASASLTADSFGANTLTNTATVTNSGTAIASGLGKAALFNANGQSLNCASNSGLQGSGADLMGAAWIELAGAVPSGGAVVHAKWAATPAASEYVLFVASGTSLASFAQADSGGTLIPIVVASTFGALSAATPYLLCWYIDTVNLLMGISVNGGAYQILGYTGIMDTTTTGVGIGQYATPLANSGFPGQIGPVVYCKSPPTGVAAVANGFRDLVWKGGSGAKYPY